jgi:hypothetical protein
MALTKIDDRGLKTPIDLLDNEKIRFGTDNDLEIYHAGNHARLHNTTGNFSCQSPNYYFNGAGGTDNCLDIIGDGAVKLYYDGSQKFETYSGGCTVTGGASSASLKLNTSDGTLRGYIYGDSNNHVYLLDGQGHSHVKGIKDGSVEIYHDNTKQFETVSGGVQITGNLGIGVTPNRELHVKGLDAIVRLESTSATGRNVLEFYDNTGSKGYIGYPSTSNDHFAIGNNDNTDMWFSTNDTERLRITNGGVVRIPDNGKFSAGAGDDLQIYHDGTNSKIHNATGTLGIRADNLHINNAADDENLATFTADGAVNLYHNGVKKFETQSTGVRIQDHLHMHNEDRIKLGSSQNFEIYHNGTNAQLDNTTGNLELRNVGTFSSERQLQIKAKVDENSIVCKSDGATELYHDNVKKFETWAGGSVFDYYEEGSWTPGFSSTVLNSMGNPLLTSGSYDYRVARYVKIGPFVCISVHIQLTSNFAYETGASGTTGPIGIGGMPSSLGPGVNTNPRFIPGSYMWKEGGSSGTTKTFHARISSFFNPQLIEICDEDADGVSSLTAADVIEDSGQYHLNFSYVLAS